jgi:hypothetical protein
MKKETYADRAKKIMSKYKTRLGENFDKGDSLALEAMNQELSLLQEEQEQERAKLFPKGSTTGLPTHAGGGDLIQRPDISHLKYPTLAKPLISGLTKTNNPGATDAPFESKVPWMGAASGIIGNLLMNKQINLPEYNPEEYDPGTISPHLVNYGRSREQIMSERDLANNMIQGSARGMGSQNALMENTLAGVTGTQRVAGQQFNQSLENESNTNAQILNDTDRVNAQLQGDAARFNTQNKLYANQINRENLMMNTERKDARTQGILDSITGYGRDLMEADKYDQMMNMMTPDNYKAYASKDSPLRRVLQISPEMGMKLSKTDRFKETGGYLSDIQLFGDDKYEKLMMRLNKNKKN